MIQRSFGLLCDETSAVEKVRDIFKVLWMEMRIGDELSEETNQPEIWVGDGQFCLDFHMS